MTSVMTIAYIVRHIIQYCVSGFFIQKSKVRNDYRKRGANSVRGDASTGYKGKQLVLGSTQGNLNLKGNRRSQNPLWKKLS